MNNKSFRTCFIRCVLVSSTLSNLFAQDIDPTQHVWIDEKAAEIAIVKYNALQDTLKYYSLETFVETRHSKGNFDDAKLVAQRNFATVKLANNILTVEGKSIDVTGFKDIMRCQNTNVYTAILDDRLYYYTPKNGKFIPTFKKLKVSDPINKIYLETIKQYDKYDCHAVVNPEGDKMAFLVSYDFPRKKSYALLVVVDLVKNNFDSYELDHFIHGKHNKVRNLVWQDKHKIANYYLDAERPHIWIYDIKAKEELYHGRFNEKGQWLNQKLCYTFKFDYLTTRKFVDYIGTYGKDDEHELISFEENADRVYKNSAAYKDSVNQVKEQKRLAEKQAYADFASQTDSVLKNMQKEGISVVGQIINNSSLFKTDTTKTNKNDFKLYPNFHYIVCKMEMKDTLTSYLPSFYVGLDIENNIKYYNFIRETNYITEFNNSAITYAKPFTTTAILFLQVKYGYNTTIMNEKTMICLLGIPSQNWATFAQKYFPKAVSDAPIELVAYQNQVVAAHQAERENRAAQAARSQKENDERNERNRLETNRKNAEENARVAERNKRNAAEKANEASKSETKTKSYVAQYKPCSSCHGTGKKTCTYCGGQGRIYKITARGSRESNYCTACSGGHKTCLGCSGSGKVKTN